MMALANKNCVEAEFVFEQDKSGKPYPTALTTVRDWETKTYLSCGSLLAHSCVSAMLLAAHDKTIQQAAFKLGKQFGLTWQVYV